MNFYLESSIKRNHSLGGTEARELHRVTFSVSSRLVGKGARRSCPEVVTASSLETTVAGQVGPLSQSNTFGKLTCRSRTADNGQRQKGRNFYLITLKIEIKD